MTAKTIEYKHIMDYKGGGTMIIMFTLHID